MIFLSSKRSALCASAVIILASSAYGWRSPDQRTVYDDWVADIESKRAAEAKEKEWSRRASQSGYADYSADLAALNEQSRLQAQWKAEEAQEQARKARRDAARRMREEEVRRILELSNAAEAGNADALMEVGRRNEGLGLGGWGIAEYQRVRGSRRGEALWRIVSLLRAHAEDTTRLASFRSEESFLTELSASGDVKAMMELASYYRRRGDPYRESVALVDAGVRGREDAQLRALALLADEAVDNLPIEETTLQEWLERAAGQGDVRARYLWGERLLKDGSSASRGLALLTALAQSPSHAASENEFRFKAALLAGLALRDGAGATANGQAALPLLVQAANGGLPSAQRQLGLTYLFGVGVPADVNLGLQWLEKGAAQGDVESAWQAAFHELRPDADESEVRTGLALLQSVNLRCAEAMIRYGQILYEGRHGVDADPDEAAYYFGQAIRRYPHSLPVQEFLGEAYSRGEYGLERNVDLGTDYLRRASAQGSRSADVQLQALARDRSGPPSRAN